MNHHNIDDHFGGGETVTAHGEITIPISVEVPAYMEDREIEQEMMNEGTSLPGVDTVLNAEIGEIDPY